MCRYYFNVMFPFIFTYNCSESESNNVSRLPFLGSFNESSDLSKDVAELTAERDQLLMQLEAAQCGAEQLQSDIDAGRDELEQVM